MIAHLGAFDINNLGDRLYPILFEGLTKLPTRIYGVQEKRMPEYDTLPVEKLPEEGPVVIGGGDILREDHSTLCNHYKLSQWPKPLVGGFGIERPAVYLSCGVPRPSPRMYQAKFMWVRDWQAAKNVHCSVRKVVAPDLAVLTSEVIPRTSWRHGKPIALVQFSQAHPGCAAALRKLQEDYDVKLLATNFYANDFKLMTQVANELELPIIVSTDVYDWARTISGASLVVASSLHVNILAFSYGVPHLFAPMTRETKIRGFLEVVGLPQHLALSNWSDLEKTEPITDWFLRKRAMQMTHETLIRATKYLF